MTAPVIEVRDAVVRFKRPGMTELAAVDHVSTSVQPGEVVGLVGESGCGKSTLARSICGLQALTSGSILFEGVPVAPLGLRRRARHDLGVQMVFQNPYASLNPRRRIGSQLEDGRAIHPTGAPPVADLLASVGLDAADANRYPYQFSGGQRQRIAIARAMAAGPRLLIGDEPIASLDASLQIRIAELMLEITRTTGTALVFITHDLAIVRQICDRIVVMFAGRIVEEGPAAEIWDAPRERYTQRLLAAIPIADGEGRIPLH